MSNVIARWVAFLSNFYGISWEKVILTIFWVSLKIACGKSGKNLEKTVFSDTQGKPGKLRDF